MIGLDTNVLARCYVQDESNAEARKQHDAARRLIESVRPIMICKTAVLEVERVMRGCYGFSTAEVGRVMQHLLSLPQVTVEDRQCVVHSLSHCDAGLEFADALHHSSYRTCESVASFESSAAERDGWG